MSLPVSISGPPPSVSIIGPIGTEFACSTQVAPDDSTRLLFV